MTDIPRRIVIPPFEYSVACDEDSHRECEQKERSDLWGHTDQRQQRITVNPNMSQRLQRLTVLHELLHACAFAGGHLFNDEISEEEWVSHVAPMLLAALRQNPDLVAYLVVDELNPIGGQP